MATRTKKANRWLVKQRRRKRIPVVGIVQRRDTGRPELLYGRRCREGDEEHEVFVAEFEIITRFRVERDAKIGTTEADGVATVDARRCFVEIDNSGKMTLTQMQAKWKRYDGVTDCFILVVAGNEARMQRLRGGAERVKDLALFTTFDRLRNVSEPWVDWYGKSLRM